MKEREIWYEPHPVSPERKKELLEADFKIIDERFKPANEPAKPVKQESKKK